MKIFILLCIAFDLLGIIIYRDNPFVIATCTFAMAYCITELKTGE